MPSLFIGGKNDWGVYQTPGAFEKMQKTACTRILGTHLVNGAGHWVQQEQAEEVSKLLIQFLHDKAQGENRLRGPTGTDKDTVPYWGGGWVVGADDAGAGCAALGSPPCRASFSACFRWW